MSRSPLRKLTDAALQERERAIARNVVEAFLREFLERAETSAADGYDKYAAFPRLIGRLGISDELFQRWLNLEDSV